MALMTHKTGRLPTSYDYHLIARLLDFFGETTPWSRRLWDVGMVLALDEAWEAGEWVDRRVLSQGALDWLRRSIQREFNSECGLGGRNLRKSLGAVLDSKLELDSRERRTLRALTDHIRHSYLRSWAKSLHGDKPPSAERLARAVSSHLLGLGYSANYLHRWANRYRFGRYTAEAILEDAIGLVGQPVQEYELLVPFIAAPHGPERARGLYDVKWGSKPEVMFWLRRYARETENIQQNGGFLFRVEAKDAWAAARQVANTVEQLLARGSYLRGGRDRLSPEGRLWVKDGPRGLPLRIAPREADVLSLAAEHQIYIFPERSRVDEALELAAPLNQGTPGPAISGGWAALESLLFEPGDKQDIDEGRAVAAERLAALVACSWPRAELTSLANRYNPDYTDRLSRRLQKCESNRRRCLILSRVLMNERSLRFQTDSDQAAAVRMRALLNKPRDTLRSVQGYVEAALRRFYRQRNIVLHGGATDSIVLAATLQTAAPLIGAGLDRIVHAFFMQEVDPLVLAARAAFKLNIAGTPDGGELVDLLE
jgi:hypothetical protein